METWLAERAVDAEVIVVDDGSRDGTTERCLAYAERLPGLQILRLAHNRGKGYAVRQGMLQATGEWRAFLDADGSTDPFELAKLLDTDRSVVIASVAVEGAHLDRPQSGIRSSLGRFGNVVIQRLVLPGIEDSQTGCKVFRGDVAESVFQACTLDGWGFDVEALALARSIGHEPLEVGVSWEHRPVGHVRPWHYATTIGEVVRVRRAVGHQDVVTNAVSGNVGT
ncbi:MAG: glycosyltransferase [Acidimicrobiales bacterium]|nr:glycosyltransferase [Acidimicrobiales bacterium]